MRGHRTKENDPLLVGSLQGPCLHRVTYNGMDDQASVSILCADVGRRA